MSGFPVLPRHREIAVHHANRIQERKLVQQQVVEAQEELLDFPHGDHPNVLKPSASDVARFGKLIQPFNPDDYEELFTERKCADRCAYVFCPNPSPRIDKNRATLDWARSASLGKVVKRDDRWCSKECIARAMFIKVQLSSTPAWERLAKDTVDIELLTDNKNDDLLASMAKLELKSGETDKIEDMMKDLALERGRTSVPSSTALSNNLKENIPTQPAKMTSHGFGDAMGVEGYVPKTGRAEDQQGIHGEDEEEDYDWVM